MRIIQEIPICNIVMDRWSITPQTLGLTKYLKEGGIVPPIHVASMPDGRYKICDGRHRTTACKLLGKETVLARFSVRKLKSDNQN